MSEILQGTTPSLTIKIGAYDFKVSDVVKLELSLTNNGTTVLHDLDDVTVDSTANTFTYDFTEAETLALNPGSPLEHQWRFMFESGKIVGTGKMTVGVADLYSETPMTPQAEE